MSMSYHAGFFQMSISEVVFKPLLIYLYGFSFAFLSYQKAELSEHSAVEHQHGEKLKQSMAFVSHQMQ